MLGSTKHTCLRLACALASLASCGNDDELELIVELDWQPSAVDPLYGHVIVGEDGHAAYFNPTSGILYQ